MSNTDFQSLKKQLIDTFKPLAIASYTIAQTGAPLTDELIGSIQFKKPEVVQNLSDLFFIHATNIIGGENLRAEINSQPLPISLEEARNLSVLTEEELTDITSHVAIELMKYKNITDNLASLDNIKL